jgi:EAL domain-containing protein (putative c-di-GMP-specific phosphodiesterase class I)
LHELDFGCSKCVESWRDFNITMAYQPIVDLEARSTFAYEALVRGANGEGAAAVLSRINDTNLHSFDQLCRATAIRNACELGISCALSINFLPNAVYNPVNCLRTTLAAADRYGMPATSLILEVTESEEVIDRTHLASIIREYRKLGISVAIDDFGAGHSGLNLLAEVEPDIVKLDRFLVSDIDKNWRKQAIVGGLVRLCRELGSEIIAEGIETAAELRTVRNLGVRLVQGYFLARPALGRLDAVSLDPALA